MSDDEFVDHRENMPIHTGGLGLAIKRLAADENPLRSFKVVYRDGSYPKTEHDKWIGGISFLHMQNITTDRWALMCANSFSQFEMKFHVMVEDAGISGPIVYLSNVSVERWSYQDRYGVRINAYVNDQG
jgi:hypothetical protein